MPFHFKREQIVRSRYALIEGRYRHPAGMGMSDKTVARKHHQRRPHDEDSICIFYSPVDVIHDTPFNAIAIKNHMRFQDTAAGTAVWYVNSGKIHLHIRIAVRSGLEGLILQLRVPLFEPGLHVPSWHYHSTVHANHLIQSAMQIDYLSMACLLVQAVNILCDQPAQLSLAFQPRKCPMCTVGRCL